ncbi:hypothetical protein AB5V95_00395 [Metamycoplasma spumans]|uniref:hypothetical protein n=1 Tax=Metamycoplasma spumans TaxID=92406 RepID=UPI0004813D6E
MNHDKYYFDKKIKSTLKNFWILSCCLIPITLIGAILSFLYSQNSKPLIYSLSILNALIGFYGVVYFTQSISFYKFRDEIKIRRIPKSILILSIITLTLSILSIINAFLYYTLTENYKATFSNENLLKINIFKIETYITNIALFSISIPLTILSHKLYKKLSK